MNEFVKFRGLYNNLHECLNLINTQLDAHSSMDNFEKSLNEHRMSYLLCEDPLNAKTDTLQFTQKDAKKIQETMVQLKNVVQKIQDILPDEIFSEVPAISSLKTQVDKLPNMKEITTLVFSAEAGKKGAIKKMHKILSDINIKLAQIIKLINAIVSAFAGIMDNIMPAIQDHSAAYGYKKEDLMDMQLMTVFVTEDPDSKGDSKILKNITDSMTKLFTNRIKKGESRSGIGKIFQNIKQLAGFSDAQKFTDAFMKCTVNQALDISNKMRQLQTELKKVEPAVAAGVTVLDKQQGDQSLSDPESRSDKQQGDQSPSDSEEKPTKAGRKRSATSTKSKKNTAEIPSTKNIKISDIMSAMDIPDDEIEKYVKGAPGLPSLLLPDFLKQLKTYSSDQREIAWKFLDRLNLVNELKNTTKTTQNIDDEFDRWAILAGIKK